MKRTIKEEFEHLKILNRNRAVKLRVKKIKNGFSLFLDYWNGSKHEYLMTGLHVSGTVEEYQNDLKKFKIALKMREKQEDKAQQKDKGEFHLKTVSSDIATVDFIRAFAVNRPGFKKLLNYLIKFNENPPLDKINGRFGVDFLEFLQRQNLKKNTIYLYFNNLKTALNYAVRKEIISKNPITVSAGKEEAKREFLTLEEIKRVNQANTEYNETKQAFLFSCFTGLRLSDIVNLTFSNIVDNKLVFKQQKTGNNEILPLTKEAVKIADRQREARKSGKVFNLPGRMTIGRRIRKITEKAGIEKRITFHCARHTFATLNLTFGNDLYTTSKLLGHKNIATTQIYAKIIDEKKKEAVDRLPEL